MSKYIALVMFFVFSLFGCGREREDFTGRNVLVYEQGPRRDLIVVSVEDIPKTNLSRIVVVSEKNYNDAHFSLISSRSQSEKLRPGEKINVVEISYSINSYGLVETFWVLKDKGE